jgi:hypothetical protein
LGQYLTDFNIKLKDFKFYTISGVQETKQRSIRINRDDYYIDNSVIKESDSFLSLLPPNPAYDEDTTGIFFKVFPFKRVSGECLGPLPLSIRKNSVDFNFPSLLVK